MTCPNADNAALPCPRRNRSAAWALAAACFLGAPGWADGIPTVPAGVAASQGAGRAGAAAPARTAARASDASLWLLPLVGVLSLLAYRRQPERRGR